MSGVSPRIVALSVDPALVELGGGVDLTVRYSDAVLIRVRRPDGVHVDLPAPGGTGSQVLHVAPISGGDIIVTALNPVTATSSNPYGESAPQAVAVRTYSLPPTSQLRLPDLNLGIPAVQIEANEVHIGEPALTILTELALLRGGIEHLPAPFPEWLAMPPLIAEFPLPTLAPPPLVLPPDTLAEALARILSAGNGSI
jgi:hypothetical protein